jgi:hypothetical protein
MQRRGRDAAARVNVDGVPPRDPSRVDIGNEQVMDETLHCTNDRLPVKEDQ